MRPRLLHPTEDVALDRPASHAQVGIERDLELEVVIDTMARGDGVIASTARRVLLDPVTDLGTIRHRQAVLRTCLAHPDVARSTYAVAVRTLERRKKVYWGLVRRPDAVVYHGLELVHLYLGAFRSLRRIADEHGDRLGAVGLGGFLATLRRSLDDAFLEEVDAHLRALRFRAGIGLSARLGAGHRGRDYVLERPDGRPRTLGQRLVRSWRAWRGSASPELTYRLPSNHDSGVRDLAAISARGLGRTAQAVAAACDDLLWHFR
jgi:hypothetical protein